MAVSIAKSICSFLVLLLAMRVSAQTPTEPKKIVKIVGGVAADMGQFPYAAHILVRSKGACGGTLLSNRHILTAAHCVLAPATNSTNTTSNQTAPPVTRPIDQFSVVLGKLPNDTQGAVNISDIKVDAYNTTTSENDLAVLVLAKPISFSAAIRPARLAPPLPGPRSPTSPPTDHDTTQQLIAMGWGRNGSNLPTQELRWVNMTYGDETICHASSPEYVSPTKGPFICSIGQLKGRGVCRGDSGGPLMWIDYTQYSSASSNVSLSKRQNTSPNPTPSKSQLSETPLPGHYSPYDSKHAVVPDLVEDPSSNNNNNNNSVANNSTKSNSSSNGSDPIQPDDNTSVNYPITREPKLAGVLSFAVNLKDPTSPVCAVEGMQQFFIRVSDRMDFIIKATGLSADELINGGKYANVDRAMEGSSSTTTSSGGDSLIRTRDNSSWLLAMTTVTTIVVMLTGGSMLSE